MTPKCVTESIIEFVDLFKMRQNDDESSLYTIGVKAMKKAGTNRIANKVAQVTIFFWIMKIIATTLGETAGDLISQGLNWGYYVGFAITIALLAIILFF